MVTVATSVLIFPRHTQASQYDHKKDQARRLGRKGHLGFDDGQGHSCEDSSRYPESISACGIGSRILKCIS